MPDIYDLLAKHFLNETSAEEELKINQFKDKSPEEYKILLKLWNKGNIKVTDFDSSRAWDKVQTQINRKQNTKIIPLRKNLMRVAIAAAIALLIGISSLFIYQNMQIKMINIQTGSNDKVKQILLSDGSTVWLNKNSSISYPEKFSENRRNIQLKGEAFFKVAKNPAKPFVVHTSNARITVLGTSFNIRTDTHFTKVDVATGKVNVSNLENTEYTILTAGYSANVEEDKLQKFKTDNINYLAWKTGAFYFKDIPLKQAVSDLNTYYNNQFIIDSKADIPCRLTAEFSKADIEEVLEVLRLACNIKITKTDKGFLIQAE
jgi:ferric-dicitrate binding protein FerR (iron transport regulator)